MPTYFSVDVEKRVVRTTFRGVITFREVADLAVRLANEPSFDPEFCELAAFDEDSDFALTFSDFKDLAHLDPFSRKARRALVVRSPAAFGVARIYQTMRDNSPHVRIFHSVEEAFSWLTSVHAAVDCIQ